MSDIEFNFNGEWDTEYRVLRRKIRLPDGREEVFYGIYEIYLDAQGNFLMVSDDATPLIGGTEDELREFIDTLDEARSLPTLDFDTVKDAAERRMLELQENSKAVETLKEELKKMSEADLGKALDDELKEDR